MITDVRDDNLPLAQKLGAKYPLLTPPSMSNEEAADLIRKLLPPDGPDCVIDCAGYQSTILVCFTSLGYMDDLEILMHFLGIKSESADVGGKHSEIRGCKCASPYQSMPLMAGPMCFLMKVHRSCTDQYAQIYLQGFVVVAGTGTRSSYNTRHMSEQCLYCCADWHASLETWGHFRPGGDGAGSLQLLSFPDPSLERG